MSILIKGMEIPTSCAVCDWSSYVGNGRAMCSKTSMTEKTDIMSNRRPDWCPLMKVLVPHGDLVDRETLIQEVEKYIIKPDMVTNNMWNECVKTIMYEIKNAHAIIEKEDE